MICHAQVLFDKMTTSICFMQERGKMRLKEKMVLEFHVAAQLELLAIGIMIELVSWSFYHS